MGVTIKTLKLLLTKRKLRTQGPTITAREKYAGMLISTAAVCKVGVVNQCKLLYWLLLCVVLFKLGCIIRHVMYGIIAIVVYDVPFDPKTENGESRIEIRW